ncbi:hypothetical protein [Chitinophaga niastensis]|uniref:hypothetical protein n=1 Tax=Chitinophaga niastensis TaxID=536980 RepID=UPI000D0D0089|nr:hypothetical protein [Chitinophaga niastensis]
MNTTTPYEDLIAAKLDQIPVPDMADSIWDSIEMQLDAVVDAPDKRPVPKYKGKGWYGFIGIIVAVIILWWYYNHKNHAQKNTTPLKTLPATEKAPPVTDSNTLINHIEKKNIPIAPVNIKKDTLSLNGIPNNSISFDSVSTQNLPPTEMDSLSLQNNRPQIRFFDSVYIIPPRKKPKGVKGITNDDYKISVDKDSIKKGS